MADNWGKLILGVLAGAAIWKGIGPNGQQQVTDTLNTCAARDSSEAVAAWTSGVFIVLL